MTRENMELFKWEFESKGIDIQAVENEVRTIMDSVIQKGYSIAEVEAIIKSLSLTSEQLKYRKAGKEFSYEVNITY